MGLSVIGGVVQHAVKQQPQATVPSSGAVPGYISIVVFEWLFVLHVRMGVHKRGMHLRDLVVGRWVTPKELIKDIAPGAGCWAVCCPISLIGTVPTEAGFRANRDQKGHGAPRRPNRSDDSELRR